MNQQSPNITIHLTEQTSSEVDLRREDAKFLADKLNFEVFRSDSNEALPSQSPLGDECDLYRYQVNPRQYVGHFSLGDKTVVVIHPKIPAANVFRMLAYVYAPNDSELFKKADALYAHDTLLFEPLVEHFNQLVKKRVRKGLFQDYISRADNLRVFKGKLLLANHIQQNVHRNVDRVACHFYEQTYDVDDNQIVKWTLFRLPGKLFSERTHREIGSNLHQFEPVGLLRPHRSVFDRRHYHRLNEDYRPIHSLCKLFLEGFAISEQVGDVRFHGFVLDMNDLFERFVTQAFHRCSPTFSLSAKAQDLNTLSAPSSDFRVTFRPDIIIHNGDQILTILDAKYKRITMQNHDIYQMISYAIALKCPSTYLFYPISECDSEGRIRINNTNVTIDIRGVDIQATDCVSLVEQAANNVLREAYSSNPQSRLVA